MRQEMANLNEDVLCHIFSFLKPLERVQVSQVCKLWSLAASREWRKIKEISYLDSDLNNQVTLDDQDAAQLISAECAEKIASCVAPFVEVLNATVISTKKTRIVMFGPLVYRVMGFNSESIFKILIKKATRLTEIRFDKQPKPELAKILFERNKIQKVTFEACGDFYKHIQTDGITELDMGIRNTDLKSFENCFPDLKKVKLELNCECKFEPSRMLSKILPFIKGVTSLDLVIMSMPYPLMSDKDFLEIATFTELEKLSLQIKTHPKATFNCVFERLAAGCLKLRDLKIVGLKALQCKFHTLLTLPKLECLEVDAPMNTSYLADLPAEMNLSELRIKYDQQCYFDLGIFSNFLKKIPKLKVLELGTVPVPNSRTTNSYLVRSGDDHFKFKLVCGVIKEAVISQGKDLFIKGLGAADYHCKLIKNIRYVQKSKARTLKIYKKHRSCSEIQSLKLIVPIPNETWLFEKIETYVKHNLESLCTCIV